MGSEKKYYQGPLEVWENEEHTFIGLYPVCPGEDLLAVAEACRRARIGKAARFEVSPEAKPITAEDRANAERLEACWNACVGVEKPEELHRLLKALLNFYSQYRRPGINGLIHNKAVSDNPEGWTFPILSELEQVWIEARDAVKRAGIVLSDPDAERS